jgi:uncharacterized protein (TIGR03000 family)
MYSVVMMMALSGGAEVVDFGRGGCYGYACIGCAGVPYGGYGGYAGAGYGCYGSYYGRYGTGRYWGSCGGYGYGGYGYGGGCYGCYGCSGCCGVPTLMYRGSASGTPSAQAPDNRATVVVTLPPEAKLKFDGHLTTSTSATRRFVTPPLKTGLKYEYVLRAEIVRDGVPSVVERTVLVRANEEARVSLDFASASFAQR